MYVDVTIISIITIIMIDYLFAVSKLSLEINQILKILFGVC